MQPQRLFTQNTFSRARKTHSETRKDKIQPTLRGYFMKNSCRCLRSLTMQWNPNDNRAPDASFSSRPSENIVHFSQIVEQNKLLRKEEGFHSAQQFDYSCSLLLVLLLVLLLAACRTSLEQSSSFQFKPATHYRTFLFLLCFTKSKKEVIHLSMDCLEYLPSLLILLLQ